MKGNKFFSGFVSAVLVVAPFWCIVIAWLVWRGR
jgi:hypothetical protein